VIDHTHDPSARTWLAPDVDNAIDSGLQTLPYGVFSEVGEDACHLGVAIAGHVLDLSEAQHLGLVDDLDGGLRPALRSSRLNRLLALTPGHWSALRHRLFALLVDDDGAWRGVRELVRQCLVPMAAVRMHLPIDIGDYTDFYASIHHATNVGTMLRPEQPLLPNYRHVPIGYHGRASSVVVSGTPIVRPHGQRLPAGADVPVFGPSERLDYELEVGLVIGGENPLGAPVPIDRARDRVFGLVLLNDWSARDIQAWEYQPLGPFLAKSFATTIGAWVVPLEALEAQRVPVAPRGDDSPALLPYLVDADDQARGGLDLALEVWLSTQQMRAAGQPPARVSHSNLRDLSWTPAQLVAHHTSNGCNLEPGDLLGTGTVSGPRAESRGCLLERTWRGTEPLTLSSGEVRRFLEDGDLVRLEAPAHATLFCEGELRPAVPGW
jgi:fumarylacetoacetase